MIELVFPALRERQANYESAVAQQFQVSNKILHDGFPDGSYVMMREREDSALSPRYNGPYKVLRRNKGGSYVLLDSTGKLFPNNVPPSHLKLVDPSTSVEDTHEVEAILDHRGPPHSREYLVRWRGYNEDADTWEPVSNFHTEQCIDDYWQRRGKATAPTADMPSNKATKRKSLRRAL